MSNISKPVEGTQIAADGSNVLQPEEIAQSKLKALNDDFK